jgi:ABC-type taurine transport system substrate-binding protein
MMPFVTNYAKLYSQVEEKITTIHKLSGLTLDEIIEKLAKGYEFVPPKQTTSFADLKGGEG